MAALGITGSEKDNFGSLFSSDYFLKAIRHHASASALKEFDSSLASQFISVTASSLKMEIGK